MFILFIINLFKSYLILFLSHCILYLLYLNYLYDRKFHLNEHIKKMNLLLNDIIMVY
jgi:hypothetical protein